MAGLGAFADAVKQMGVADDGMVTQAQQIWEMLDEMASTNPEGYKKFMQKQKDEKKRLDAQLRPPEPAFALRAAIAGTAPPESLWLSFCGSSKVPLPKGESAAIPVVTCRPEERRLVKQGRATVHDIVFHPDIVARAGREPVFKSLLVELALQSVEQKNAVLVDRRTVRVVPEPLEVAAKESPPRSTPAAAAGSSVSGAMDNPASLLDGLRAMASDAGEGSGSKRAEGAGAAARPDIVLPFGLGGSPSGPPPAAAAAAAGGVGGRRAGKQTRPLIEPLDDVAPPPAPAGGVQEPAHELRDKPDTNSLVVVVSLPLVESVAEVDVDITTSALHLVVPGRYSLDLALGCRVDVDSARAKFVRRTRKLKLTLTKQ